MAANEPAEPAEPADPAVEEADRRAERAKASLLARLDRLKHKVSDAKQQLDPLAHISNHPLPAVGIAFALGVIVALTRGTETADDGARRSLGSAALTGLAALGLRIARDVALGQLGHAAKQWWIERDTARAGVGANPTRGTAMADVEPFLEH